MTNELENIINQIKILENTKKDALLLEFKKRYNIKYLEFPFYLLEPIILDNIVKLDIKSVENDIFTSKMMDFIIKIPKKEQYDMNIYRSLVIQGYLDTLNIPVFTKPFCLFKLNNVPILCEEFIHGITMHELLQTDLSFTDFLNIFFQLLLALQSAQENFKFCHYDLHLKNIIIQIIEKPYKYKVSLKDKKYSVKAKKFLPVIIDYGISSIKIQNINIGCNSLMKYGIFNFLIKGIDMYKFLFCCFMCAQMQLKKQIASLFLFYGSFEPYKVIEKTTEQLNDICKTYLKQFSGTKASEKSPKDMINWLLCSKAFSEKINCFKVLH